MPTATTNPAAPPLLTVREAARRLGVKVHQLSYAAAADVEPRQRAGIIRLYSADQLPALAAAVGRTANRGAK